MKVTDPEKSNSTGWFKDPVTGEDLTGSEVREVTCAPGEQFVWPTAIMSDGKAYQLCSRLWNDDEKACYKEYRNKGKTVETAVKAVKKEVPVSVEPVRVETAKREAEQVQEEDEAWEGLQANTELSEGVSILYDPEAVSNKSTEDIIAEADVCLGTETVKGVTYALLQKAGSRVTRYVPRSLVPDEEMSRLLGGES